MFLSKKGRCTYIRLRMINRLIGLFILIAMTGIIGGVASADNKSWHGANGAAWGTGPWVTAGTPTASDTIVAPNPPVSGSNFNEARLDNNYTVAAFTLSPSDWGARAWRMRSSSFATSTRTLTISGNMTLEGVSSASSLTFFNSGAGLVNVDISGQLILRTAGFMYFGTSVANFDFNNLTVGGLTTIERLSGSSAPSLILNANSAAFNGGMYFTNYNASPFVVNIAHDETRLGNTSVAFLDGGSSSTFIQANQLGAAAGTYGPVLLNINGNSGGSYSFGGIIRNISVAGNSATLGIVKSGNNTQKLSNNSIYTGVTQLDGGALIINGNNSSANGNVTVAAGATLGGNGTLGGATSVSGILSPGDGGIGTLNVAQSVTWNGRASASSVADWVFELGTSPNADLLNITSGDFLKNTSAGSTFRFDFGGTSQAGTYKLVDWTGSTTFSASDFSYVNLGAGLSATFAINGTQLDVTIAVACDQPTITLGSVSSLCAGLETSANLTYSATTESPVDYRIDYDANANAAGFLDVSYTSLPASPIVLTIPANPPADTYNAVLYVRNAGGCESEATAFVVPVVTTPLVPGTITQGNPSGSTVCAGDTTVTYSIAAVPSATSYNWGVPSGASITAGQGSTQITVSWAGWGETPGSGNVTVNAQNSCGSSANNSRSITVITSVLEAPTATSGTDVSTTGFTANWNALAGAQGYYLDVAETEDFSGSFVVNNLDKGTSTSHTLSGLSEGLTYYYRVRAYNACGASDNSVTIGVLTPSVYAGWDMSTLTVANDSWGPDPYNATEEDSRLTVGGLTRGSGLSIPPTSAQRQDRSWGAAGWSTSSNPADAIANGDYIAFSLQADAGQQMSLYAISVFDYFSRDVIYGSVNSGPASGILQYSIDGAAYTTITTVDYSSSISGSVGPIDLTGVSALQNVPDGAVVYFRILNYDTGTSAAEPAWFIYDYQNSTANDFEIRGTFCSTPIAYNVTGGGAYCSDDSGALVGLSDSQTGVRYQLYRNGGATAVGSPVYGTGNAISFGYQSVVDTYTVEATRLAGECTADMNGSVAVSITTAPGAPTGLSATPSSSQVSLSWNTPGGAVTGYRVFRSLLSGGPYSALAAGTNVQVTSFVDTTSLNGYVYYYTVRSLNGVCDSVDSAEVEAIMPQECPTGIAPAMANPGNKTVTIGNFLSHAISASESVTYCTAPTLTHSALPSGMTYQDEVVEDTRTRTFSWTPIEGQQGTYPITVTATDDEDPPLSVSQSFLIYVGNAGETGTGTTNPPPSQSNWYIPITDLTVPAIGDATVTWSTTDEVAYDVYTSTQAPGSGGSWSKLVNAQVASGSSEQADVVQSGSMRFYQVVPSGQSVTERGVWGIVRPTVPTGISFLSPPVDVNRSFNSGTPGSLGAVLADALPAGTLVYILSPGTSGSFDTILELNGSGQWIGGDAYSLPEGQGFMVSRPSGSTAPIFEGPVGNDGTGEITIQTGYNIIGISEGESLAASSAFESISPVGSYDENAADQVVIMAGDGSWRRLIRRPNGIWYDTASPNSGANTSFRLSPGDAYYYIRAGGSATLSF